MLDAIIAIGTLCIQTSQGIADSTKEQAKCKAYYAACVGPLHYFYPVKPRTEAEVAEKIRQCMLQREPGYKWSND